MSAYLARTTHILDRIVQLAAISEDATGATVTRRFGTPAFVRGRDLVQSWFEAAGLDVRLDGIGNLRGALLGGLVLGVMENWGSAVFGSEWKDVVAFVLLVLILLVRPSGLLGEDVGQKA